MRKVALILLCTIFLYAENLKELIDIALNNSTHIKQSQIKVNTQKQNHIKSQSLYLPTLSIDADISQQSIDTAGVKTDANSQSAALNINQLLYDFGKSSNKIETTKHTIEASKKELDSTSSNIVLSVKKAYYDILNKDALIKVAQESIKIDELQLYEAKEYYKAQVKTKIDVTNAQLQLSNSKMNLLKAEFNLKKANAKLITLLAQNDIRVTIQNQNIKNLAQKIKNSSSNLDDFLQKAKENRAELKMYQYLQKSLHSSYRSSKSDFYPTINLAGSYKDSSSNDLASLDKQNISASVFLKWELFSGFRTTASKQIALNELKTVKQKLKEQELLIQESVTNAYFNMEQNRQSIDIALLNIELSRQNLDLAQERYKNGLNSLVELNSAKLEFITAKNELVNQYYAYKISEAILEFETGVSYTF